MKNYKTFTEIETDLKRLKLERQIALEELKWLKSEFKEDIKPSNWFGTTVKSVARRGLYNVLNKFVK